MTRPTLPRFSRCPSTNVFSLLMFCLLMTLPLVAAEPSSRVLDSGWQFRAVSSTDKPEVQLWHAAQSLE
jgi:hypothetical protein